jgi:hypothetical protein
MARSSRTMTISTVPTASFAYFSAYAVEAGHDARRTAAD